MSLQIRPAVENDMAAVLALYAQPDMDNGRVLDLAQAQALWAQFARYPSYRLFVAVSSDHRQVVGSYALLVMHKLAHQGTPSAVVEDVVVRPDQQRQGIGRQLMAHAMREAQAAGCYKLALSSNHRRADAHAFYNALGFQPHGVSFVVSPSAPPETVHRSP